MLKLYFDNCCFCRPFDDLTQEKIALEEKAIEDILAKYEKNELEIYTSKVVDLEMSKIKDQNKKRQVEDLYDSLHMALAESMGIDYLITTDKLFINGTKRLNSKVKVISPIEFIIEVI